MSYRALGAFGAARAQQTAADTLLIASKALGTTTATAATLATLAGTSAATMNPIGWIAAIGVGLAAGAVATVGAVRSGKVRQAEAVQMLISIGIPSEVAAEMPGFCVDATRWSRAKRVEKAKDFKRKLDKKNVWDAFQNEKKLEAKLGILAALELAAIAEERGALPRAQVPAGMSATGEGQIIGGFLAPGTTGRKVAVLGGVGLVVLGIAIWVGSR